MWVTPSAKSTRGLLTRRVDYFPNLRFTHRQEPVHFPFVHIIREELPISVRLYQCEYFLSL